MQAETEAVEFKDKNRIEIFLKKYYVVFEKLSENGAEFSEMYDIFPRLKTLKINRGLNFSPLFLCAQVSFL